MKKNKKGFAIAQVLIAISLMGALGGISYMYNQNQKISFNNNLITTATTILNSVQTTLVNEIREEIISNDIKATLSDINKNTQIGNDGIDGVIIPLAGVKPYLDGFEIPHISSSNKLDPWGTIILYCPYNNGNGLIGSNNSYPSSENGTNTVNGQKFIIGDLNQSENSVVFVIISAGQDKIFQTNCELAKNNQRQGDDGIRIKKVSDVKQGVGGTKYYGDPVLKESDLENIKPFSQNELRIINESGVIYKYDQNDSNPVIPSNVSNGGWSPVTPKNIIQIPDENCDKYGLGATSVDSNGNLLVCN